MYHHCHIAALKDKFLATAGVFEEIKVCQVPVERMKKVEGQKSFGRGGGGRGPDGGEARYRRR